jgi:hypothetical protein
MRWLQRADLGTGEIAFRTAQNLYSLHCDSTKPTA